MDPNFKPYRTGKLTVLERYPCGKRLDQHGRNGVYYLCRCDCGKEVIFGGDELSKHPYSCGYQEKPNVNPAKSTGYQGVKKNSRNMSGAVGVYFDSRRKKWRAEITFRRRKHFLGYFESVDDAVKVREDAVEKYYGTKDREEEQ